MPAHHREQRAPPAGAAVAPMKRNKLRLEHNQHRSTLVAELRTNEACMQDRRSPRHQLMAAATMQLAAASALLPRQQRDPGNGHRQQPAPLRELKTSAMPTAIALLVAYADAVCCQHDVTLIHTRAISAQHQSGCWCGMPQPHNWQQQAHLFHYVSMHLARIKDCFQT
jgi:hypothetical protein